MAINRTYLVALNTDANSLDIVVDGPVGTAAAPVNNGTAAPAGWVGSDGQYYELQGRTLPVPTRFGDADFVPRLALGWNVSVQPVNEAVTGTEPPMAVRFSRSLVGVLAGAFAVNNLADPAYGPVLRLEYPNSWRNQVVIVTLTVFEAKDFKGNGA